VVKRRSTILKNHCERRRKGGRIKAPRKSLLRSIEFSLSLRGLRLPKHLRNCVQFPRNKANHPAFYWAFHSMPPSLIELGCHPQAAERLRYLGLSTA
jgi:hypothetical protein